ncbi:hypothetical protein GCM10010129_00140 [Streptomyces fumigatiscleroticus]|nr:hypothetical protein GCM10010129_00140 [Streptomyces fumigatiscleroticus]
MTHVSNVVEVPPVNVLATRAAVVVDGRGPHARPAKTAGELSRLLVTHLEWLGGHAATAQPTEETTELVRAARHVLEAAAREPAQGRRRRLVGRTAGHTAGSAH